MFALWFDWKGIKTYRHIRQADHHRSGPLDKVLWCIQDMMGDTCAPQCTRNTNIFMENKRVLGNENENFIHYYPDIRWRLTWWQFSGSEKMLSPEVHNDDAGGRHDAEYVIENIIFCI